MTRKRSTTILVDAVMEYQLKKLMEITGRSQGEIIALAIERLAQADDLESLALPKQRTNNQPK